MTVVAYLQTSPYSGVMISDGQSTIQDVSTDKSAEKIHRLNNSPCAIGFAGYTRISNMILKEVSERLDENNYSEIKSVLSKSYKNIMRNEFKRYVNKDLCKNFNKLKNKDKRKLMHVFEEEEFSNFICFGYNKDNDNVFCYTVKGDDVNKYVIGSNDEIIASSVDKSMRKYMRTDRKMIPSEKAVELLLKSVISAESDSVSGEPNIVLIDREKYLDLDSQESMLLYRTLILFEYDKISKNAKNDTFRRIIKEEEPYESVAEDLFRKLPSKTTRDLLFTRHL